MSLNFASIHQRVLTGLFGIISKLVSAKGVLKIPVFLLMLPAGLLLTILGMAVLACLFVVFTPFFTIRHLLWLLSSKGRLQHIQSKYQRRKKKIIIHQQRRRLKLSQSTDREDLKYLVELGKDEISKRKQYVGHTVFIETKRRLNRCLNDMNFENALFIYSAIVDTELDLLDESLNEMFH